MAFQDFSFIMPKEQPKLTLHETAHVWKSYSHIYSSPCCQTHYIRSIQAERSLNCRQQCHWPFLSPLQHQWMFSQPRTTYVLNNLLFLILLLPRISKDDTFRLKPLMLVFQSSSNIKLCIFHKNMPWLRKLYVLKFLFVGQKVLPLWK